MKKFLVGIATVITMAVLCVVSAGAEAYGDYTYSVLEDGTVEITDYTGSAATLEIPSEIDGKKVTSIGDKAFQFCYSLNSVIIPDGITNIGDNAFYACVPLTSINIPASVNDIGDYAFYDCKYLTSMILPYGVESIGDYTFSRCFGLNSIIIPDSITSIGNYAFYNCTGLKSIAIPEKVTSVGEWTFSSCSSLSSVKLSDNVTSIGADAFYGCSSLADITIPDSVREIGDYAFNSCSKLRSVIIPDSVTSIGKYAFYNCEALSSVVMTDSVTDIGNYAFGYSSANSKFVLIDGFVINCYENSAAQKYASDNGIEHKILAFPVTNLSLNSANHNSITLVWTENNEASGYVIEQYIDEEWVQIADITDNTKVTYKVTGLAPCTTYNFRMKAYSEENIGEYTDKIIVNTTMTAVKDFTSPSRSTSAIRLNWTENAYATGYVIEQYTSGGWVQIADINDSSTVTYKVTALKPGTAYKFRMKAYSVTGYGEMILGNKTATLTVNTMASPVSRFAIKSRSSVAIRLRWAKNTAVDGYVIEQKIDGKWVQIADISDNATTEYKVTGLKASTKYRFRMKTYSVTKYGEKTYSAYTSTLAGATNPSAVSGLRVKSRSDKAIRLAWTSNASANGYLIEQYVDGNWVQIADVNSNATTEYKVTGLASGTTYKFRIKTYNIIDNTTLYSEYKAVNGTTLS
ncbi:MAG: leucine-rich repeat protein [Ruminiclostridium sp.]|nr:leucine-rich repeat protein [Ruminiclostridium sp.]